MSKLEQSVEFKKDHNLEGLSENHRYVTARNEFHSSNPLARPSPSRHKPPPKKKSRFRRLMRSIRRLVYKTPHGKNKSEDYLGGSRVEEGDRMSKLEKSVEFKKDHKLEGGRIIQGVQFKSARDDPSIYLARTSPTMWKPLSPKQSKPYPEKKSRFRRFMRSIRRLVSKTPEEKKIRNKYYLGEDYLGGSRVGEGDFETFDRKQTNLEIDNNSNDVSSSTRARRSQFAFKPTTAGIMKSNTYKMWTRMKNMGRRNYNTLKTLKWPKLSFKVKTRQNTVGGYKQKYRHQSRHYSSRRRARS
jgi:hypothetical protein